MTINYYPPRGPRMDNGTLTTLALVVTAIGVWVLVIAGTNAI